MAPHLALAHLLRVTGIPTAAGREYRVVSHITAWCKGHPELALTTDASGNMVVRLAKFAIDSVKPLYITAHLDHPGFVIENLLPDGTLEVSFRGGVMAEFFELAPITLFTGADEPVPAVLTGKCAHVGPFGDHYFAKLEVAAGSLAIGDVGRFSMPGPVIDESTGTLHTPACDDLSAVAAALAVMDALVAEANAGKPIADTRLLFTRAEEIGFIGAIAACRHGTMSKDSVVLALENSRSFADSPIGGGPIVRVGDRISIFTPWLTAACAERAEKIFGGAAVPRAQQKAGDSAKRPWQRKLMAGGACEATVFCTEGYNATCLCLPLGNYHNMANLAELQAGTYDAAKLGPPRAAPEFVSTKDYLGLVDLLVSLGTQHPVQPTGSRGSFAPRIDSLWSKCCAVLDEPKAT